MPDEETESDRTDDPQNEDPLPDAKSPIADTWSDGKIWFQKFLPTDTAWGSEEFLTPVPEEQRGLWAVRLSAPAFIGERNYRSGAVVAVEDAQTVTRLIKDGKKISAIAVPWFERLIPADLLLPQRERIKRAAFLKSLLNPLIKGLLFCAAAVIAAIYLPNPMAKISAVILGILFGVYPLMQVFSAALQPVHRLEVDELNRRRVNNLFFFLRFRRVSFGALKIGVGLLAAVFVGQKLCESPTLGLAPSIEAAALVKSDVFEKGQWWRILTSGVMHGMVAHLLVNGMALWSLGRLVCAVANPAILALVFLVSVVTGGLASLYFGGAGASVGASGGLLGCLGFLLVLFYRYRGKLPGTIRFSMLHAVIVVSVLGYLGRGFIDNAAHAGGFVGGAVVALLMWKSFRLATPASAVERALGIFSAIVLLASVAKVGVELLALAK